MEKKGFRSIGVGKAKIGYGHVFNSGGQLPSTIGDSGFTSLRAFSFILSHVLLDTFTYNCALYSNPTEDLMLSQSCVIKSTRPFICSATLNAIAQDAT